MKIKSLLDQTSTELLEKVPAPVSIHDLDNDIVWANRYYRDLIDITMKEIKERNCFSLFGLEEPCPNCPSARAIETGEQCEAKLCKTIRGNSAEIWLVRSSPITDYDGNVIGTVEVVCDISEKEKIEKELLESREKYLALYNNVPQPYQSLDEKGRFLDVNPRWLDTLGYKRDNILGKNFIDLVHPGDKEDFRKGFREFKKRGSVCNKTLRLRHRDGHYLHACFEGKIGYNPDGSFKRTYCVFQDITEKRQWEEKLRRSEEYQRSILRAAPVGIGVVVDRVFKQVNQRFCEMTGYRPEELEGRSAKIIYPSDEDYEYVGKEKYAQIRENNTGTVETRFKRKNGRIINVILSSTTMDSSDLTRGVTFTAMDITERKKAEQAGEKLRSQLIQSQKLESIGRLAGGVAHDYNNMLSVILGYTDMAMNRVSSDTPLHDDLTEIHKAASRSRDITAKLLAFARKQAITPEVLNLNETVSGMIKMMKSLIGENIELDWIPGSGVKPVRMDPSQIDQIIANLCVNARDAVEGMGKITIETGSVICDENKPVFSPECKPGEYVLLKVSDNGCGIEETELKSIFEPFFTTKSGGEGIGLGLATVYGIVKQNEGFINVRSKPGEGTEIEIYMPGYSGEADDSAEENEDKIPGSRGETVLLVEDEEAILELESKMLEKLGYNVIKSADPQEALSMAEESGGGIDLLITDVVMPGMNGRELADRVRAKYPSISILFMSGYSADVIAHRGILDRAVNYIQKPFTLQDLGLKARKALDQK